MSGEGAGRLRSKAAVLSMSSLDTDQLVPARFCTLGRPADLSSALLHDLRVAGVVDLPSRLPGDRSILVAGADFAIGSGREHTVWALQDAGVDAVVAPSFGGIFMENALLNGLWPVVIDEADHEELVRTLSCSPDTVLVVDAHDRSVKLGDRSPPMPIAWSDRVAGRASSGLDVLSELLAFEPQIATYERRHHRRGLPPS